MFNEFKAIQNTEPESHSSLNESTILHIPFRSAIATFDAGGLRTTECNSHFYTRALRTPGCNRRDQKTWRSRTALAAPK